MGAANPYGVEQMALYFSTVAGGATPVAGNLIGEFRGEPSISDVSASAKWRGQDRVASRVVLHDRDVSMTIPGFSFDSSVNMAKLVNGTHTSATTLHGGAAAARQDKLSKNSKPLTGEFLIEGTNTDDGNTFQIRVHNAYATSVNPTLARTDFATLDLNLELLADSSGDVWSVYNAT